MEAQKKKVGNYLLLNKVGAGQFGTVYKGVLIEDQKKVYAIKCIPKSKLENNSILNRLFQTEMHVMSKLNHPNIMHLYEFMETASNYYLVIQFCGSGDMENYLKKMGKLGEEEAVYFLMQIMNAFQVLHKNKIMHRDVKLANIFLQEDRIVIGDFGFAKQGVDVTKTKLGTPITMAPELLTGNGQSYNSKADLWSIGVCFYQMLFGKTPFEAKSYDDLKEKVKTQSGSKLKFPKDTPISEECKSLLISLLQFDPVKRIEWKDFFNHALFNLHAKSNQARGIDNINNSLLDRQNELQIKNEFNNNKKTAEQANTNLIHPEQLESGNIVRKNAEETPIAGDAKFAQIAKNEDIEEAHRNIKTRYIHEKKKIIFIMYTVRKLRNQAKLRNLFEASLCDKLMLAACLLLKKGSLMNESAINSLKKGTNVFNMPEFASFLRTDENYKIQKNFEEDENTYRQFADQMFTRFGQEVTSPELKSEMAKFSKVSHGDIAMIDTSMMTLFTLFKKQLGNQYLDPEAEADYSCACLHFYYSITSERTFFFSKDEQAFEWKTFENETKQEFAKNLLLTKTP